MRYLSSIDSQDTGRMFKVGDTYDITMDERAETGELNRFTMQQCTVIEVNHPVVTIERCGLPTVINTNSSAFIKAEPSEDQDEPIEFNLPKVVRVQF